MVGKRAGVTSFLLLLVYSSSFAAQSTTYVTTPHQESCNATTAPCAGEAGGGASDDETAMLQFRREGQGVPAEGMCPFSNTACAGNQCCPGAPESGGKTYPCPTASKDYADVPCEAPLPPMPDDGAMPDVPCKVQYAPKFSSQQTHRVPVSSLSDAQQTEFITAIFKMKETMSPWASDPCVPARYHNLTWYNLIVAIHGTNWPENSFAHMGIHFGTWHREYLWLFELGLNDVMGNPDPPLVVPYWDWTSGAQTSAMYKLFGGDGNAYADNCMTTGPFAWPLWNLTISSNAYVPASQKQCLKRALSQWDITNVDLMHGAHMPSMSDIANMLTVPRYDSFPWDASALGSISWRNIFEGFSAPNNEGDNAVINHHVFHGMHNNVHLAIGQTMGGLLSPNDPIFFPHHANVDRLLQSWLLQTGGIQGTGMPNYEEQSALGADTPVASGYPAQIVKIEPLCHNLTITVSSKLGFGMTFLIGDGSAEDWKKFLNCAWGKSPSGPNVVGMYSAGKRILMGFPPQSPLAGYIPPLPKTYTDPIVFKATDVRKCGDLIYEEFTLGIKPTITPHANKTHPQILLNPSIFTKVLSFGLTTPPWFQSNETFEYGRKFKLDCPFEGCDAHDVPGIKFKAIAATHGNEKMDMEGYSPDHYYMPGYLESIKHTPLILRYDGAYSEPSSSCVNTIVPSLGCKTNGSAIPPASQTTEMEGLFGPPAAKVSFLDPWSAGYVWAQVQTIECLTYDQLEFYGYINLSSLAATEKAKAMLPKAAKFCIVEGFIAGAGGVPDSANQKALKTEFGDDNGNGMPASLLFGPLPVNKNSKGEQRMFEEGFDVTDHIFTGARPGGNAEDDMIPFNQLGEAFQKSPAFFFDAKTANYDKVYTSTSNHAAVP
mmetsp:Transcript_15584/g.33065  ORF Transcript_15584/g.33065 Transcript_15584/m.33065 type:complete len:884 (+) Transcript_15584:87-2738(+)